MVWHWFKDITVASELGLEVEGGSLQSAKVGTCNDLSSRTTKRCRSPRSLSCWESKYPPRGSRSRSPHSDQDENEEGTRLVRIPGAPASRYGTPVRLRLAVCLLGSSVGTAVQVLGQAPSSRHRWGGIDRADSVRVSMTAFYLELAPRLAALRGTSAVGTRPRESLRPASAQRSRDSSSAGDPWGRRLRNKSRGACSGTAGLNWWARILSPRKMK